LKITSWRVVRLGFANQAFDGEGAKEWGGRWNSAGRAVVYTSATTSLGLLEKMVHADAGLLPLYVTIPAIFDAGLVEVVDRESIPADWRNLPAPYELQQIGDAWVDSMRTCILEVPSVIVPHESNYVLNPEHPDFETVEIGAPVDLEIDSRLV